ncbi:MAG TPA: LLM class flavin-dependent oxidoreductase [Dehalococcoidia bacterium]|nr:LLM class flavin-dependent oxidoreductase [Dehalococcoidia bacterium]
MKFGFCPGHLNLAGNGGRDSMAGLIELARLAQERGFDGIWLAEEDFAAAGKGASALVAAAAVAVSTSAIRIGVICPLGLSHPIYTAEDMAVLDHLSAGRLIAAVRPPSAGDGGSAYGISGQEAGERFAEALEVCLRAWAPAPFRFQGKHFRIPANPSQNEHAASMTHISVTPKPAQPALPVWVVAVDDETVRTAARFGLPIIGAAGDSLEGARSKFELYRSLLGYEPVGRSAALLRDIDVTDIEAVIQQTERCRDELGVHYLVCRIGRPGASVEEVAQALRLLGHCLIPEFRMFGYPKELRSVSL